MIFSLVEKNSFLLDCETRHSAYANHTGICSTELNVVVLGCLHKETLGAFGV